MSLLYSLIEDHICVEMVTSLYWWVLCVLCNKPRCLIF